MSELSGVCFQTENSSELEYNTFMKLNTLLCFLFLVAVAVTAPFAQQDVDFFLKANKLIPPSATLKTFSEEDDKALATYADQFTTFKFVLGHDAEGKLFVIFRQQMTQINFSNNDFNAAPQMAFIPRPMIAPPMPQMELLTIPAGVGQRFDHQMMSGNMPGFPLIEGQQNAHRPIGRMPCRINEEDVKTLLKENLVIFSNADIQKIEKLGFERGNGIILEISLANEGKLYKVKAGYMPRWRRLTVLKIEEQKGEVVNSPLDTGKELIGKIVTGLPETERTLPQPPNFNFESLIQSFVEKLLARRNEKIEEASTQTANPPLQLGSEGQPMNPTKLEIPEVPQNVKPLLLGSEGEKENPFRFEDSKQLKSEQPKTETETKAKGPIEQGHHIEQNSEQISELVTEVLSKIKLKTK